VVDDVYWWADGIWFNVRLPVVDGENDRLCCLVIVGPAPTVARSWWRWPTATGNRPTLGPRCYATF